MNDMIYAVPVASVIALIFAFVKSSSVNKADAGTPEMQIIAGRIADGAKAFLIAEYKVLAIFVGVVAVLLAIANMSGDNQSPLIALSFVFGAVASAARGTPSVEKKKTKHIDGEGLLEHLIRELTDPVLMGEAVDI